jgi:hypothetical protein
MNNAAPKMVNDFNKITVGHATSRKLNIPETPFLINQKLSHTRNSSFACTQIQVTPETGFREANCYRVFKK